MSILFKDEWKDNQGNWRAIPDLKTKNTSFLRTAQVLKRMGVANYAFMLGLYDPDLVGVDVHDLEEDTPENEILRTKVQTEARINTWYFLRECIRIYEQGGSPVRFRLDRGSCAMTWCWLNGLDYCGMQPRQTGKDQPLTAKILTPSGWTTMGEIKRGDWVSIPGGGKVKVLGTYPQGIKDIYRVTLADGRSTECGLEHLWRIYPHDDINEPGKGWWKVKTLAELMECKEDIYIPTADPNNKDNRLQKLVSIDHVGQTETKCIEIDHYNHLYITDDYIVTHNTVCALSLIANVMYNVGEEFVVAGVAKDNDLRQENVKRVKAFGENLPEWWLIKDRNRDKTNSEELYYNEYRTHYQTFVAQKEAAQADKQGRGGTMPMVHYDEFDYISNIKITYTTMSNSSSTARENAKKNGKPHSNIITTTAGDPLMKSCKEAADLLDGAMPFSERLYDCKDSEQLHTLVSGRSEQKMILGEFSHLQLGYTDDWLRDRIRRGRMSEDQVKRDFMNMRVSIAEKPIIPKHHLAMINSSQRDPCFYEILSDKFVVIWYVPEEVVKSQEFRQRPFVFGCDSSEMIGKDSTTLVGVDPRSLDTMFTFRCNEGNLNKVGVMIGHFMLKYPKAIWIPENKSSGTSLIDNVSVILRDNGHNPFTRIFNWIVQNKDQAEFARFNIDDRSLADTQAKKYFGIKTDKTYRNQLYSDVLLEAAERTCSRVKDQTLIRELNSLTMRNGRVDHAVGGNDDTVIAWLLAIWFLLNGKHLDVYGIKPGSALSLAGINPNDKSKQLLAQQEAIRRRIEHIEGNLKVTRDLVARRVIEADLCFLRTLVDESIMPTPEIADDLHRDPKRFTDRATAEASRPPIDALQMERNLRAVLGIRQ